MEEYIGAGVKGEESLDLNLALCRHDNSPLRTKTFASDSDSSITGLNSNGGFPRESRFLSHCFLQDQTLLYRMMNSEYIHSLLKKTKSALNSVQSSPKSIQDEHKIHP